MARLTLTDVTKAFGNHRAVDAVSLTVEPGEFVAILGPSGCGKTTLLRMIAGFDRPDSGTIRMGDRVLAAPGVHVPAEERRMGIVFQSYALWPHMNVGENVGYALRVQKVPAAEREKRIRSALETVGLSAYRDRNPGSLSGGQRQRVALARCLAMEPQLVLLDEPLANLDVHLRAAMEEEFAAFHKRTGTAMFYITHDQAEAMALADRIAVMDQGQILQCDKPSILYREPANETVARFIGEGMILPGQVDGTTVGGRVAVTIFGHRAMMRCRPDAKISGAVKICLRAQDLVVDPTAADAIVARLKRLVYQGGHFHAELLIEGGHDVPLGLALPEPTAVQPGDLFRVTCRDGWIVPEAGAAP
jgi:iron(III) transport system ATP-binding protein